MWSVSCYTDRLLANQIAGKPVRISCHVIMVKINCAVPMFLVGQTKVNDMEFATLMKILSSNNYLLIQDSSGSAETDDLRHQPHENEVRKKAPLQREELLIEVQVCSYRRPFSRRRLQERKSP